MSCVIIECTAVKFVKLQSWWSPLDSCKSRRIEVHWFLIDFSSCPFKVLVSSTKMEFTIGTYTLYSVERQCTSCCIFLLLQFHRSTLEHYKLLCRFGGFGRIDVECFPAFRLCLTAWPICYTYLEQCYTAVHVQYVNLISKLNNYLNVHAHPPPLPFFREILFFKFNIFYHSCMYILCKTFGLDFYPIS